MRHVRQGGRTDMCLDVLWADNPVSPYCGCTTPTPDPTGVTADCVCGHPLVYTLDEFLKGETSRFWSSPGTDG